MTHLKTKLTAVAAFALLLTPLQAQTPWQPTESGNWNSIQWSRGGTPGDTDAVLIGKNYSITNGSATHSGDLTVAGLGKLSLTSYSGQLRTGTVLINGEGEWVTSGIQKFDKIEGKAQSLTIANEGLMQTWQTQIGFTGGEYAVATVKNLGSQMIQLERLTVGFSGNGSLAVSDQGYVKANNSIIGDAAGSNGIMTVTGRNTSEPYFVQSTFDSGSLLTVGKRGTGGLTVTGLGIVTAKSIIIGQGADGVNGTGTVTVSGGMASPFSPRSTLSATEGDIRIGDGGTGNLIVNDGGAVNASGKIILGSNGGDGTLTIGDAAPSGDPMEDKRIGTVTASEIHGDGGTAKVNINLFSYSGATGGALPAPRITGNAEVNIDGWDGGVVALANNSTYSGGTNILGAGLLVTNATQVGTGTIYVSERGSLYLGTGVTLSNTIEFANGGSYSKETEVGTDLTMTVQSAQDGGIATTASILAGTQTSTSSSYTTSFNLSSSATNDDLRVSDVFSISGTGDSVFVLELAIDGAADGAYLGWLNDNNVWVNAILENEGNTDFALQQFSGSYSDFSAINGYDLAQQVGAWGIYDGGVWAVINHNSDFAVVAPIPEPSTYALILGGAFALHTIRRKRK